MLLLLFTYLTSLGWKIPAAFSYSSTRMMLAALTALLVTIFLGPRCIKKLYELKTGQSIRVEDCPDACATPRKKEKHSLHGWSFDLIFHFYCLDALDGSYPMSSLLIFPAHHLLAWRHRSL